MKKGTIYLLGFLMIGAGVLSSLFFTLKLQHLFQDHLTWYGNLFEQGRVSRCLYLDTITFLYIASILFKNFYYIMGGILILFLIEFGRELGLLAALIGFVTETSFRLMQMVVADFSAVQPFSMIPLFLFLTGVSIHVAFFYVLTRKPMVQYLTQGRMPS
ncbi:MAG: hypothetical protein ABH845_00565 [Candidatus Omnitrophota bacterium]